MEVFIRGHTVHNKAFHELILANLNNEVVTTLINHLNRLFLKDELNDVYKQYVKFDYYYQYSSTKMEDYIKEYRISTISVSIQKLSHCDRQLVLNGVYYTGRATLLDQIKKA